MNTAIKSVADDHESMIHDCEIRESQLSEKEASFIESIGRQFANNSRLSIGQIEWLEDIWERVTA